MRPLIIQPASHGGFVVMTNPDAHLAHSYGAEILFAGPLDDVLVYIREDLSSVVLMQGGADK